MQASLAGKLPQELEVEARLALSESLLSDGVERAAEALEILKKALELDPTCQPVRDQAALATQKSNDRRALDVQELGGCSFLVFIWLFWFRQDALKSLKLEICDKLSSNDVAGLIPIMDEVAQLPLTWDAVRESAIGKEIGRCSSHPDSLLAQKAKGVISKLHKVAKAERPLWVR